jgi:hypothetical protein
MTDGLVGIAACCENVLLIRTAILIIDEPFQRAMCGDRAANTVAKAVKDPEPYQGGYADFVKHESLQDARTSGSPSRASMFDDLMFYHKQHHTHLSLTKDPVSITNFAQKIVASEYMLLVEYHRYLVNHLGWQMTRRDDFGTFESKWVEQAWSDINSFHRRIEDHIRNVAAIRAVLGHAGLAHGPDEWISTYRDFRYIEAELERLKDRSDAVRNQLTSLAGVVGNKQAINEARSVRVLTVLGMAILPLSLVASLFSMSGNFSPGGSRFWVYFAVSIPLVFLVFGLAYVSTHASRFLRMIQGEPAV